MSEPLHTLDLPGLDGANPLGFLAALGTLTVLSETDPGLRLGWHSRARWVPFLASRKPLDEPEILQRLATRLRGKPVDAGKEQMRAKAQKRFETVKTQLKKAKQEFNKQALPPRSKERDAAWEKEVSPFEKAFSEARKNRNDALEEAVPSTELALGERPDCTIGEFRDLAHVMTKQEDAGRRSVSDMIAALGAEISVCDDERIWPTPFSFVNGSGKQWFLDTARQLMTRKNPTKNDPEPPPCVTIENLNVCLFQSWTYMDEGLSMRWDPVEDSRYALRLDDPGEIGAYTVWMANLLAYTAISLFPCAMTHQGPASACWGEIQDATLFLWPLWTTSLSCKAVYSLLSHPSLAYAEEPNYRELSQRGVAAVFSCRRLRNGKFTNFSPAIAR